MMSVSSRSGRCWRTQHREPARPSCTVTQSWRTLEKARNVVHACLRCRPPAECAIGNPCSGPLGRRRRGGRIFLAAAWLGSHCSASLTNACEITPVERSAASPRSWSSGTWDRPSGTSTKKTVPLSFLALGTDVPAMRLDQLLHQGEPDAAALEAAAPRARDAVKALEQARQFRGWECRCRCLRRSGGRGLRAASWPP